MWIWAIAGLANAITPESVPNPRSTGGWVSDVAGVFDEDERSRINALLGQLEADTSVEVAVATIDNTDMTPKEFATALFNHWGVGKEGADNGLLVVLVMGQRRLEMETGYGLEPILTDGWLGIMQREEMVPAFRAGDFAAGIEAGLSACEQKIRDNALEAQLGRRAREITTEPWPERGRWEHGSSQDPDEAMQISLGGAGLIMLLSGGLFLRRRRRTCDRCDVYMPMLSEADDDAHLSPGQQTEESIGSVNWLVHCCSLCDEVRTFRRARLLSGHSRCPSCSNRTRSTRRQTISPATYSSSGTAQVTERCAHCSYNKRYTVVIPRKQRSSSSSSSSGGYSGGSSSGGGSFGGGSSGGGGAGSSW